MKLIKIYWICIFITIITIILLSIIFPLSNTNGEYGIGKARLKSFSLVSPEYYSLDFEENTQRSRVSFIELNRNSFLEWEVDKQKMKYGIVLNSDIKQFEKEIKENSKLDFYEFLKKSKVLTEDKFFIPLYSNLENDSKKISKMQDFGPPYRVNSTITDIGQLKQLKKGMKIDENFFKLVGSSDTGNGPLDNITENYTHSFAVNSPKILRVFMTFNGNIYNEPETIEEIPTLNELIIVTQKQNIYNLKAFDNGSFDWESNKNILE